jgi:hypothetical protein
VDKRSASTSGLKRSDFPVQHVFYKETGNGREGLRMRKFMLLGIMGVSGAIGLLFFLLLNVSATPPDYPSWTVRLQNTHGLAFGDVVEEARSRIGQVLSVSDVAGSPEKDVVITLDALFEDRLCEQSAFFVKLPDPKKSGRPVLNLVVYDETSPLLPPGSQIVGVESEAEVEVRRQMVLVEEGVRGLAKGLQELSKSLETASRSEEKKQLEDSMVNLYQRFKESEDEIVDTLTEEMERWKKVFEKFAPEKLEKKSNFVS